MADFWSQLSLTLFDSLKEYDKQIDKSDKYTPFRDKVKGWTGIEELAEGTIGDLQGFVEDLADVPEFVLNIASGLGFGLGYFIQFGEMNRMYWNPDIAKFRTAYPTELAPADDLFTGFMDDFNHSADWRETLLQWGYNKDRVWSVTKARQHHLDLYDYFTWWWKNNPDQYAHSSATDKYAEGLTYIHILEDFRRPLPDPTAMVMYHRQTHSGLADINGYKTDWNIPVFDIADTMSSLIQKSVGRHGYYINDSQNYYYASLQPASSMELIQGNLELGYDYDYIGWGLAQSHIPPDQIDEVISANLYRPRPLQRITWQRRRDIPDDRIRQQLQQWGVHPNAVEDYMEGASQFPSLQDMATFATREAFPQQIPPVFEPYADSPQEFVDAAKKIGVDKYWCDRYWYSHWRQPGPQQLFEMFQREAAEWEDVDYSLKAAGYSGFWRDKLKQISYRTLSRVDLRRMYRVGTMSLDEVEENYRYTGYSPENAEKMREFTSDFVHQQVTGFRPNDVIGYLKDGLISKSEAYDLLDTWGLHPELQDAAVNQGLIQQQVDLQEKYIELTVDMYVDRKIDYQEFFDRLNNTAADPDYLDYISEKAYYERKDKVDIPAKSEIFRMYLADVIDYNQAEDWLYRHGYSNTAINAYLSDDYLRQGDVSETRWPPKEDIKGFLQNKLIDRDQARNLLTRLGFSDTITEKYIQLWTKG